MQKLLFSFLFVATTMGLPLDAFAQSAAKGSVIEHTGETGELIVSRDGVVYWLSAGDDLFAGDVIRAQKASSAKISFSNCIYTLPEKKDVILDSEFCSLGTIDGPTMAQVASDSGTAIGSSPITAAVNAPLIVGGTMLSAGGIVAAVNGGAGGTESAASIAAGAPQATASSN